MTHTAGEIVEPFDLDRDLVSVLQMTKRMHESGVFASMEMNLNKMMDLFLRADRSGSYFFDVSMAWDENLARYKHTGFFLGVMTPHFGSDDYYSTDLMLWVDEQYRGGEAGELLVESYKSWADESNVKLCMLGSTVGVDPERSKRFFEKCGLTHVGYNFIK